MTNRRKIKFEVHIESPITDEDREGLERAIKAVVGIIIAPGAYRVEAFILP